ncbi:hypothetical protein [Undibacterium sp.]|uniref:hypothetical protein n=1 Tax=Undibacterium sp. TaxID=1914977 RepID=UPI002731EEA0|nr:hypothetical protein [Undibacterium sp.]MDP1977206.1 hypothetical protein [Undibacterium sp.]
MRELADTVKQNTAGAEHANNNALFASALAQEGGIAFQTIMLALNLSVGATRVLEQGKGSAAVATQMHELA